MADPGGGGGGGATGARAPKVLFQSNFFLSECFKIRLRSFFYAEYRFSKKYMILPIIFQIIWNNTWTQLNITSEIIISVFHFLICAVYCFIIGGDCPWLEFAGTKHSIDHCSKKVDTWNHPENVLPASDVCLQSVKIQMKESDQFVLVEISKFKSVKNKWLCDGMTNDLLWSTRNEE